MKNILSVLLVIVLLVISCIKETFQDDLLLSQTKVTQTLNEWTYEFPEGWTIFSLPIEPDAGTNPAVVFNEIEDKVIIMKTWGLMTMVWWPEWNVNSMVLDCRMSYMAKFSEPCTITIQGTPTTAEIEMLQGWQMIGYPEQDTIQSGMEYYFGTDYQTYDIGKNCNGSKIFWGSQGIDCTVEPGCGFLLHNDVSGTKTELTPLPQKMYFDMLGNRIHYSDINGRAIEITMWDQRVIEIYRKQNTGGIE